MIPVTFEPTNHVYKIGPRELGNVTSILRASGMYPTYPDLPLYRARGTAIHKCCELITQGRLASEVMAGEQVFPGTDTSLWPYLRSWVKFLVELRPEIICSERLVYDPLTGVAGALDYVMKLPQFGNSILDIKCGLAPRAVAIQLAAYESLGAVTHRNHPEYFPKLDKPARLSLQLKPDGRYLLERHDSPGDCIIWQGAANVWNWVKANKLLPKNGG